MASGSASWFVSNRIFMGNGHTKAPVLFCALWARSLGSGIAVLFTMGRIALFLYVVFIWAYTACWGYNCFSNIPGVMLRSRLYTKYKRHSILLNMCGLSPARIACALGTPERVSHQRDVSTIVI